MSAAPPPTGRILLARWCRDRRAGNGILIEGSPPGKMHDAIIRFVHRQFRLKTGRGENR
jgi:hypothetical protein